MVRQAVIFVRLGVKPSHLKTINSLTTSLMTKFVAKIVAMLKAFLVELDRKRGSHASR